MFSKPSIEEYRGSKISYVDDIGIPFIGTTGIAYGYAKGFVYFAWNRNTIKKAIDTALDGDTQKATIVANTQTSTGVLFGAIVDGTKLNENINAIVKKNSGLLYMMGWLGSKNFMSTGCNLGTECMILSIVWEKYASRTKRYFIPRKNWHCTTHWKRWSFWRYPLKMHIFHQELLQPNGMISHPR